MIAMEQLSSSEKQLCQMLMQLPARHGYRYNDAARNELLASLFWCMAGGREEYLNLFFPNVHHEQTFLSRP